MNQPSAPTAITIAHPHLTPRLRIAMVKASWHADIVQQAQIGFENELAAQGITPETLTIINVPGAFEIPLHAKKLAQSGQYDAIVACALVVDGGLYRHDFVAHAVIDGLMRVQLDTDVPVFSVVLTPHHFHQHRDHTDFYHAHFIEKGAEAARACVQTVGSLHHL